MTDTDNQQAAIRKAARELTSKISRRLTRAERTISALSEKLARAEKLLAEHNLSL